MRSKEGSMTALESEAEDNLRLRKAEEFLAYSRNAENDARRALAEAVARTKRAKEKYETLHEEVQNRAVARRKAGLITVNPGY